MTPAAELAVLAPLEGTWTHHPDLPGCPPGRVTFTWALDGRFLLQDSVGAPPVPDSHAVIARDGDDFRMHYYDARGVVRLMAMTFDGRRWTLLRDAPDFTPLGFHQRWAGTLDADGSRIEGAWERSDDGVRWEVDFALTYERT